jgi:hypothetical protein
MRLMILSLSSCTHSFIYTVSFLSIIQTCCNCDYDIMTSVAVIHNAQCLFYFLLVFGVFNVTAVFSDFIMLVSIYHAAAN